MHPGAYSCLADGSWPDSLAARAPRCATPASVLELYRATFREGYGTDAVALHDALAVLEAVGPGAVQTRPTPLPVACVLGGRAV
jgi:pyrimidine-specific ribonucleoside hydrolase